MDLRQIVTIHSGQSIPRTEAFHARTGPLPRTIVSTHLVEMTAEEMQAACDEFLAEMTG